MYKVGNRYIHNPWKQKDIRNFNVSIVQEGNTITSVREYTEEEWQAIKDVAKMLREHVKDENYSYVDKLANAFNSYVAEVSIEEALRASRSKGTWIASEDHVKMVINLLRKDLSVARVIAALALSAPSRS